MDRDFTMPTIPSEHGGVARSDLELLGRHLAAENAQKMEETLATLVEDCVFDDRALGVVYHGREGAREYYQTWWDAFDIVVHSDHRHFTADGAVISEARYTGVHKGTFLGVPPTNRPIDLRLCVVITFKDGLMAGERFYWNVASLLTQLGITEIPDEARTPGTGA